MVIKLTRRRPDVYRRAQRRDIDWVETELAGIAVDPGQLTLTIHRIVGHHRRGTQLVVIEQARQSAPVSQPDTHQRSTTDQRQSRMRVSRPFIGMGRDGGCGQGPRRSRTGLGSVSLA